MILAKYIRLSSADEVMSFGDRDESCSITHQRMLLDRYIAEHTEFRDCTVLEFSDDGKSGTDFDRPGVQALLSAVRRRQIDCVMVKDFSRFGRNYLEASDYIEQVFPFFGVRFISVNDGYDSRDCPYGAAGDLNNGIRNLINEMYSRDLSQKVKAAKRQYAQRGQRVNAFPIYGYIKSPEDRRMWLPDPEAAPIVQQIFRRFLDGLRVTEIAGELNAQGAPSPHRRKCDLGYRMEKRTGSGVWNDSAVSRILRDEQYTGKLIALKTTSGELGSRSRKRLPKEAWIVIPGVCKAIITQQVFDEAQERIQNQGRPRRTGKPAEERLYYRKLKCAGCGKCLNRHKNTIGRYYFCASKEWDRTDSCRGVRIFEAELNQAVIGSIQMQAEIARSMESRAVRSVTGHPGPQDAERTRRRFQKELKRLSVQKKEIYLQYDGGQRSREDFDAQCETLTQKINACQKELLDADSQTGPVRSDNIAASWMQFGEIRTLAQHQLLNQETIDRFVKEIRVHPPNRIEICWNFSEKHMKLLTGEEFD